MLIYLCIMACGFIFLMISLALGADHDTDHDVSLEHDADHGTGTQHNWLSFKVISCFATGFGAAGATILSLRGGGIWSLIGAVCTGVVMAVLADYVIILFMKQQSSSHISNNQLVGCIGQITLSIRPGSFGEVAVSYQGQRICNRAKCNQEDLEISQGKSVRILQADGSTFIVEPLTDRVEI